MYAPLCVCFKYALYYVQTRNVGHFPLCTLQSSTSALILSPPLCQVSRMDYQEVQRLLVEALKFRRKYMELSLQEFCDTTRRMIDNELPPSSVFCVPDTKGSKVIATPEGDILPREFGWSNDHVL